MNEKTAYRWLREKVFKPYDRVDRLENIAVPGMPDVSYCAAGTEGWIEIKSPVEPKRGTTALFGSNHKVSQDQKNWFLRQLRAEGAAYLFICTEQRKMLVHGEYAETINEMTVAQIVDVAKWHRSTNCTPACLRQLRDALIAPF